MLRPVTLALLIGLLTTAARADWPMVRGAPDHAGYSTQPLPQSLHLLWTAEFENERVGTGIEPIVAQNRVFIGTHAGSLYALDAASGHALWRFAAPGPLLHSPAVARDQLIAATAEGSIYALDTASGKLVWTYPGPSGGYSAAPIVAENLIFIGSRSGEFLAISLDGTVAWKHQLPVPIRQTAAALDHRIFVTSEDLRLHAFSLTGELLWTSEPMFGQTARDYYPVAVKTGGQSYVIVRTNPLLTMSERIGRDRTLLARNAGFSDQSWREVEAWIKTGPRGNAELWRKEQRAIVDALEHSPDAQSFYLFDAATGKRAAPPPILWIAGCQAVGAPPAQTGSGDLLVFFRSAYGNWNRGVAPLVALGRLNPQRNEITPLFHDSGPQPPWNTFWGTADESQNFLVAGETALIIHQGTLSGFDFASQHLFKIHGERDTFGGFRNPAWARNEWHGPARSGVALSDGRLFWQTGSRVLCLGSKSTSGSTNIRTIAAANVPTIQAPPPRALAREALLAELQRVAAEILSRRWAPLFVDPGLHRREFFFDNTADLFEAFAVAHRFLIPELQAKAVEALATELRDHPPFTEAGRLSLTNGAPREWFQVPPAYRARPTGPAPHPFGGFWTAWAWASEVKRRDLLEDQWPAIQASFENFQKQNWTLDPSRGDLYANRYLASLQAFGQFAPNQTLGQQARALADQQGENQVAWWKRAAQSGTLRAFAGASQLDPFINRGDPISFKIAPHRHKIALFQDLSSDIFRDVLEAEPAAVNDVWATFLALYPTWPLQGEERQVHSGENFLDPPDLSLNAFKIMAWLGENSREQVARAIDLPACRADLYYLEKIALLLSI